LENWVVIALAWLAVPVVIATLAWRYSYRHEWYGSGSHVAAFALAATFGMFSYFLARRTLRLEGASEREHAWRSRLGTVGLFALFLVSAFGPAWVLIEGIPGTVSPLAKAWLVDATISTKPEGWSPEDPTKGVVGAKLWRSNLRGALAASAFLVAADLRDADLRDAILWRADLKGAILQGADLWRADVRGAAQLPDADLRGANLYFSVLRGTRILTCQQLREAREWQHAYRDAELGCDAKIPSPPPEFPAPATGKSDG